MFVLLMQTGMKLTKYLYNTKVKLKPVSKVPLQALLQQDFWQDWPTPVHIWIGKRQNQLSKLGERHAYSLRDSITQIYEQEVPDCPPILNERDLTIHKYLYHPQHTVYQTLLTWSSPFSSAHALMQSMPLQYHLFAWQTLSPSCTWHIVTQN